MFVSCQKSLLIDIFQRLPWGFRLVTVLFGGCLNLDPGMTGGCLIEPSDLLRRRFGTRRSMLSWLMMLRRPIVNEESDGGWAEAETM